MAVRDRYKDIPSDKPLTMKQQLFVEAYFASNYNGAEAAKRAGYTGNNLNRIACQQLARPNVRAAIDELAQKKIKEISLTEEYVLRKLVRTIEKAEQDNNLSAVLRGIELAAKNLGMLRERTEISGPDGEAIKYEEISNEAADFARSISRIAAREGEGEDTLRVITGGKG